MWLILMCVSALAGPVDDARDALASHARGRPVSTLQEAADGLIAAQASNTAPKDGPTWDLIASLHLAVAQDGPVAGRQVALGAAIDAAAKAQATGGAEDLDGTISGVALLLTDALRRARNAEDRTVLGPLGARLDALCVTVQPPPPATVCGQLAQALAPIVLLQDPAAAAGLAERAAKLGHPSKSLDLRVAEALVRSADPVEALAFADAALARWPSTWELHDLAGGLSARTRDFATADAHFGEALEHIHPELTRQRAVLLRKRAAARAELSQLDGAIADFEAAEPLAPADPTQRYLWGRAHVMAAQGVTNEVRARTGNKAALPRRAQAHCQDAVPHLTSVQGDPRLGAPAGQALAFCQQVIAAEASGD